MESNEHTDSKAVTRAVRYRAEWDKAAKELDEVTSRLEEIEQEKSALEIRRTKLQTTVDVLSPICEELEQEEVAEWRSEWDELAKLGIQECCYRLLVEENCPLSAISIRFRLEDRGVKLDARYKNPLAVIHTSLKRIPERVRSFRRKEFVGGDNTRVAWVRFYEAIKPAVSKDSAVGN
jgi:chromosome segregation ATPase